MIISLKRTLLLTSVALLAACSSGQDDDLMAYIDSVKARPGGRIEPLPQIKPYETFRYQSMDKRSPFERPRAANAAKNSSGPRPEQNRPKEYLEQFPLDTLDMVGALDRDGISYALLQTADGLVHRVKAGDYLGQNNGRVTAINDSEIELEEIVTNGVGGFYKRNAAIGLDD